MLKANRVAALSASFAAMLLLSGCSAVSLVYGIAAGEVARRDAVDAPYQNVEDFINEVNRQRNGAEKLAEPWEDGTILKSSHRFQTAFRAKRKALPPLEDPNYSAKAEELAQVVREFKEAEKAAAVKVLEIANLKLERATRNAAELGLTEKAEWQLRNLQQIFTYYDQALCVVDNLPDYYAGDKLHIGLIWEDVLTEAKYQPPNFAAATTQPASGLTLR